MTAGHLTEDEAIGQRSEDGAKHARPLVRVLVAGRSVGHMLQQSTQDTFSLHCSMLSFHCNPDIPVLGKIVTFLTLTSTLHYKRAAQMLVIG